jgi:hypothetical protein
MDKKHNYKVYSVIIYLIVHYVFGNLFNAIRYFNTCFCKQKAKARVLV